MAVDTIKVHNTSRKPHTVLAEDGDVLFLPPGQHEIAKKFGWNPPTGVIPTRKAVHSQPSVDTKDSLPTQS